MKTIEGKVHPSKDYNKIIIGDNEITMAKAWEIKKIYETINEREFLKDNYEIKEEELWDVALDVREKIEYMQEIIDEKSIIIEVLKEREKRNE